MDLFVFQLGLWGNVLALIVTVFVVGCIIVMFTQNTTTATTTTAATTSIAKPRGFFHKIGILCSLLGALLGADGYFLSFHFTDATKNYVAMVREVAEEVAAHHEETSSAHSALAQCEGEVDEVNNVDVEVDVEVDVDEAEVEKVVITPRPHTPRLRRSAKSAKEEMCQRLRLVSRMVRKVAGDHHSPREAARLHVDNLVNHANGRASRMEEICGI